MKTLVLASTLLAASVMVAPAMAATVQTNAAGSMVGITGVSVTGFGSFDVAFDASPTSIATYEQSFALAASNGLLSLFTTGDLQGTVFDVNANDPFGLAIYNVFDIPQLNFQNPFSFETHQNVHQVFNDLGFDDDFSFTEISTLGAAGWASDIANSPFQYSTVWTPSLAVGGPSAVPIPAAAFLFAPAMLGFMGLRRKAKQAA